MVRSQERRGRKVTKDEADMTIGRLAAAGGVGVETVRFYQRRGLLPQPPRPDGPHSRTRRYGADDLRRPPV